MKKKAELSLKYSVYMHANKLLMHWWAVPRLGLWFNLLITKLLF